MLRFGSASAEDDDDEAAADPATARTAGTVKLSSAVFGLPLRLDVLHNVVRWQLAGRRQGSACAKGISEVSGSGRKVRQQKGSGMARAGHSRSATGNAGDGLPPPMGHRKQRRRGKWMVGAGSSAKSQSGPSLFSKGRSVGPLPSPRNTGLQLCCRWFVRRFNQASALARWC